MAVIPGADGREKKEERKQQQQRQRALSASLRGPGRVLLASPPLVLGSIVAAAAVDGGILTGAG